MPDGYTGSFKHVDSGIWSRRKNVPDSSWVDYAADSFDGGDGSESAPYLIASAEQLAKLSKDVAQGESYNGKYFKVTAQINLFGHTWVPIGLYKNEEGGTKQNQPFRGSLDGSEYAITNMIVDQRADQYSGGLFGNVQNSDAGGNEIKNLVVEDAWIYNKKLNLKDGSNGILAAYVRTNEGDSVKISNVETSGTIHVEDDSIQMVANGGMLGNAFRVAVKNCCVRDIDITSDKNSTYTGGLVGMDAGSRYEDCSVSGVIIGGDGTGGFIGYSVLADEEDTSSGSTFEHCMSDVKLSVNDWEAGGFVGFSAYGTFNNCVAKGDVTSTVTQWLLYQGGFGGYLRNSKVNNCHALGKLTYAAKTFKPGGFVGRDQNSIYNECSFDNEKNEGIKAGFEKEACDVAGVEGAVTQKVKGNVCRDYDGKHQVKEVAKKEATCTKDGIDKYYICNICGTMYSDVDQHNILKEIPVIKAEGHKFGEWTVVKKPTEEVEGEEARACQICYHEEIRSVEKLTHQMEKIAKKNATCTEDGVEEYYVCKLCGVMYSDADQKHIIKEIPVIKAEGHKFGEWTVVKKPTQEAEGKETRVCQICQHEETRSVEKLKPMNPLKTSNPPETSKKPELSELKIVLTKKTYSYNGKVKKPSVTVLLGGKKLSSSEYIVKYSTGRKKVGTYTVEVVLKSTKQMARSTFCIIPKITKIKSIKAGTKAFTVRWYAKRAQITGYQVQYSTYKNFSKAKTKCIKGCISNKMKISKRGKKKTYYVRIRSYKKIGKTTYYAMWSKVKIKKY